MDLHQHNIMACVRCDWWVTSYGLPNVYHPLKSQYSPIILSIGFNHGLSFTLFGGKLAKVKFISCVIGIFKSHAKILFCQ